MCAELIVLRGPDEGNRYKLDADGISIGRRNCSIMLTDIGLSRKQALIIRKESSYELRDTESRNGTTVNSTRISSCGLRDGDEIAMGNSILLFREAPANESDTDIPSPPTTTLAPEDQGILSPVPDEEDIIALNRARSDLSALYRAGQTINTILDTEKLCSAILDIILEEIPQTDFCSIHFLDHENDRLECHAHRSRAPTQTDEGPAFSSSIMDALLKEKKAVLSYDARHDCRFNSGDSIADYGIHSVMCVPLQSRSRLLGVLQANTTAADECFNVDDLKLLTAIGMQAASAMENAALYERLAAEKEALYEANEELKKTQENLIVSEKLAAVGRLTAGIMHEVKNPMTVIAGHVSVLEQAVKDAPRELKCPGGVALLGSISEIRSAVGHCNHVIDGLLQFACQSPPSKTFTNLNELLRSTVDFLSYEFSKSNAVPDLRLDAELPPVTVDTNQIKQVFLNIILNGLEALEDGGRIIIRTGRPETEAGDIVEVRIRDTGPGMSKETCERLFEPFFSTKDSTEGPGGSGLGLSVSYGIIQSHGGTIEVSTTLGEGSTFCISLPLPSD